MGKFTVNDDKKIEEKIQGDMDVICDEILKKTTPVSVLLTGSFGRGEGSVIVTGNRIMPLKDYDILLITEEKLPEPVLKKIEGAIYDRLDYTRPEMRKFLFSDFAITLFQTSLADISSYANVGSYEIKTGSRLLYGKDIRTTIPLTLQDIPVASGFHFLFLKSLGLAGHFSSEYLDKPPEGLEKILLIYECGKAYIEMGTALSILGGVYRPGYAERDEILRTRLPGLFPDLVKRSPDLCRKIGFFTRLKLNPDPDAFNTIDAVALWFETRQDLAEILDYYLLTCSGKRSGNDMILLSDNLYQYLKKEYFHGQFRYFIRVKTGVNSDLLAMFVNYLYQKYTAVEFYFRSKNLNKNTLRVLGESPILKIFSLAPVLLFSLNQKGETDQRLLGFFHAGFNKIVSDRSGSGQESDWDSARLNLIAASDLYRRLR